MASYISVPRDLSKVKTKVFMNLTKRQILCFGAGALIGVPVFFLLKSSGNLSLAENAALQNKKLLCTAGAAGRCGNGGKSHCSKFSKS